MTDDNEIGDLERQLTIAAAFGNVQQCKEMLEQGAKVDAQNKYGFTPLMAAAISGPAFELLQAKSRFPDKTDVMGYSAAMYRKNVLRVYGSRQSNYSPVIPQPPHIVFDPSDPSAALDLLTRLLCYPSRYDSQAVSMFLQHLREYLASSELSEACRAIVLIILQNGADCEMSCVDMTLLDLLLDIFAKLVRAVGTRGIFTASLWLMKNALNLRHEHTVHLNLTNLLSEVLRLAIHLKDRVWQKMIPDIYELIRNIAINNSIKTWSPAQQVCFFYVTTTIFDSIQEAHDVIFAVLRLTVNWLLSNNTSSVENFELVLELCADSSIVALRRTTARDAVRLLLHDLADWFKDCDLQKEREFLYDRYVLYVGCIVAVYGM